MFHYVSVSVCFIYINYIVAGGHHKVLFNDLLFDAFLMTSGCTFPWIGGLPGCVAQALQPPSWPSLSAENLALLPLVG
jgi:hypothetical protein